MPGRGSGEPGGSCPRLEGRYSRSLHDASRRSPPVGRSLGITCGAILASALRSPAHCSAETGVNRELGSEGVHTEAPMDQHSEERAGKGPGTDSREKHRGVGRRPFGPALWSRRPPGSLGGSQDQLGAGAGLGSHPRPRFSGCHSRSHHEWVVSPSGFRSQKVLPVGGSDSDTCSLPLTSRFHTPPHHPVPTW